MINYFLSVCLQRKTFAVSHQGRGSGLTLDWQSGFSLTEGADPTVIWQYKFSQLRGSSDDGKSKLKLHFQDQETRSIETKVDKHSITSKVVPSFVSIFCSLFAKNSDLLAFSRRILAISYT